MADELLRGELRARGVVAFAAETTGTGFEAEWRHLAGRIAAEALGRAIVAAVLAAGFLREDEKLSLQVKSEAALRGLLVDVDATGNVRGYTDAKVLPMMDPGPTAVEYAIGSRGLLTMIRSTAKAVRYAGSVELRRGDVASDVEHYLATSEQRESVVELATDYGTKLEYAGGILVQALPGVDREVLESVRARLDVLRAALARERSPARVLAAVFADEEVEIVERRAIRFRCSCSYERALGVIRGLDRAEL